MNNVQKKDEKKIIKSIIEGMKNKKAENILSLEFSKKHNVNYDFFVICEGNSTTHVNSISESIIENIITKNKIKPNSKEGLENKTWILLDYFNIIIHIFHKNTRKLYNIEDIWYDTILTEY